MHEAVCQYGKCYAILHLQITLKALLCALSTGTFYKLKVFGIKVLDE